MRKALAASALGVAVLIGAPAVNADTPTASPTATQTVTQHETETHTVPVKDYTGLWGLLGLAGLAGLAGLRKRPAPVVHGATRETHTTPVRHDNVTTTRHDASATDVRNDVRDDRNNH